MFDWSDGSYERTAAVLRGAAVRLVAAAAPGPGVSALDLGCGTGSAASALAAAGARVVGVDPARRLLEVARAAVPEAEFREGRAEAIPAPDGAFDLAVSSFGVIFCPDGPAAARELGRVLRPGGRFVFSTWVPEGGVFGATVALIEAARTVLPPGPPPSPWGDPEAVRRWFAAEGATLEVEREELVFEATSAGAWFDEQADHHPVWRGVRRLLADHPEVWGLARARSVDALEAASRRSGRMEVASPWWRLAARFS